MPTVPPPGTREQFPQPDQGPAPLMGPDSGRESDVPPWPAWTALAAIGTGFGLGIIASIIVGIIAKAGGSSLSHSTPAVSLIGDFLFDAAFVVAALYFARLGARIGPSDFDFGPVRWASALLRG